MREAIFPRTIGATLLAFLLVAVSFVVVAPPAAAATELGGLVTNTFENWKPAPADSWITGANPEYKEGDVVPFSFEVSGAVDSTQYVFTACFHYFKGNDVQRYRSIIETLGLRR